MLMSRIPPYAWVGVVAAVVTANVAVRTRPSQTAGASIDVRVAAPPTAFTGSDTQTHLAYELSLMRLSGATTARLESLSVFAGSD
jgi:hypothetical protein